MTRTTAREIAIHLSYELGFSNRSAQELLDSQLQREVFHQLAEEDPLRSLYQEFPNEKQLQYIRTLVNGVGEHGFELDSYIEKYAIGWKFSRLPRVATAIMRVAMYEILYMPEIPNAAAINEAVEIAKGYEDEDVVAFINGILGAFVREECPSQDEVKQ
jgi:N utilization substance protein B